MLKPECQKANLKPECTSLKPRTDDQVFLYKFFLDKFYLLVCTTQIDKFFLDKFYLLVCTT